MTEFDAELRELARRAADITNGLEPTVRSGLVGEVFRALRDEPPRGARVIRQRVSQQRAEGMATGQTVGSETLGEYLAGLPALSHPERLTAIAGFRLEAEGVETLATEDFNSAYAEVRAPRPQNLSANLGRCIQRGWLVQAQKDGQKAWRVTGRGLEMLRSRGSGEGSTE